MENLMKWVELMKLKNISLEPLFKNYRKKIHLLKAEINGRGNILRWPRNTLYQQRLALTSPTSGGRSVGIVRLRITATEFSFFRKVKTYMYLFFNVIIEVWRNYFKFYPSRQVTHLPS
jgi:hypothetical protein